MKKYSFFSIFALGVLLTVTASAQTNLALGPTVTGETGYFTLLSGETLPQGEWSFGFYYNDWDRMLEPAPLNVTPRGDFGYDHHRLSASIGYGITDKFELSLMIPHEDYYEGLWGPRAGRINGHTFIDEVDASGLGNARLGGKWRLSGERGDANSVALNAFVDLPTGDDADRVVTGDTGFGIGVDWSRQNWIMNLGYHDPGDSDTHDVAEEILAGVGYARPINDRLDWISELVGTFYTGGNPGPEEILDLTTGVRYWMGADNRWAINAGLRGNLSMFDDEFCPWGGLLGLTFFPRPSPAPAAAPPPPPPPPAPPAPVAAAPAPAPPPPPPAPAPKPEEKATIYFDSGSSRTSNIVKAELDEIALKMKADPELIAHIVGYADSRGTDGRNDPLSLARAEEAKEYLVSRHQISPNRITTEGRGTADPIADNATEEGQARNRRAEITLSVP